MKSETGYKRGGVWGGLMLVFCLAAQAQIQGLFFDHVKISQDSGGLKGPLSNGEGFGTGLARLGDLDGDGNGEIAVASPGLGLRILWMQKDNSVRAERFLQAGTAELPLTPSVGGAWGMRIEAAGDWDGDHVPDLLVGEPGAMVGPLSYGACWLLLLRPEGSVKKAIQLHARSPVLAGKLARSQRFGTDIALMGDMDGDSVPEIAIGAPGEGTTPGEVWLIFMQKDGTPRQMLPLGGTLGAKTGDMLGVSVENVGDLDQNGIDDLAVGSSGDSEGGFHTGAVRILFMEAGGNVKSFFKIVPGGQQGFERKLIADVRWGTSLACLGDLDGDSLPELAVGAYLDDDGGKDKGAIYLLSLRADGSVAEDVKLSSTTRNFDGQLGVQYQWGFSLSPAGDLNQDGRPDILVSGQRDDDGGPGRGAFWIVFPEEAQGRMPERRWFASAPPPPGADSLFDLEGYPASHLVLLLDVSASMNKPEKLALLQEAMLQLLAYLRPEDRISVITYSGDPEVVLSGMPGDKREQIAARIKGLTSQGDTKPARALQMAYELAQLHQIPEGNNRIILATDGGFELPVLDKPLEKYARSEIPLSVFYFGKQPAEKLREMEEIARRGFGQAWYITSASAGGALVAQVRVKKP